MDLLLAVKYSFFASHLKVPFALCDGRGRGQPQKYDKLIGRRRFQPWPGRRGALAPSPPPKLDASEMTDDDDGAETSMNRMWAQWCVRKTWPQKFLPRLYQEKSLINRAVKILDKEGKVNLVRRGLKSVEKIENIFGRKIHTKILSRKIEN